MCFYAPEVCLLGPAMPHSQKQICAPSTSTPAWILKSKFSLMERFKKLVMALCEHGWNRSCNTGSLRWVHPQISTGCLRGLGHLESECQVPVFYMTPLRRRRELLNYGGSLRISKCNFFPFLSKRNRGHWLWRFQKFWCIYKELCSWIVPAVGCKFFR